MEAVLQTLLRLKKIAIIMHDCQLFGRLQLVIHLVETLLQVTYRDEGRSCDTRFDVVAVRNQEDLPNGHLVERSVVYNQAASSADRLMRRRFPRRKDRESPS